MNSKTVKKALMILEWAYGKADPDKKAYYQDWLEHRDWDEGIFTKAVGAMPADTVYKGLPPLADINAAYQLLAESTPIKPIQEQWREVYEDLPDYWQLMVAWHTGQKPEYLAQQWPELYAYISGGKDSG